MSKRGRRNAVTIRFKYGPTADLLREMKARHLADNPNCTYGNESHFVPPSFGQIGFFMCNPPADLRNHSRCQPPFDHEHADHFAWPPHELSPDRPTPTEPQP